MNESCDPDCRSERAEPPESSSADLPIFEPEAFCAQVANDRDLIIELIDVFLVEQTQQMTEMQQAFAAGDYERLARLAHTMKGSLGSLHAPKARSAVQELELAALQQTGAECQLALAKIEHNLAILKASLLALRESASQR